MFKNQNKPIFDKRLTNTRKIIVFSKGYTFNIIWTIAAQTISNENKKKPSHSSQHYLNSKNNVFDPKINAEIWYPAIKISAVYFAKFTHYLNAIFEETFYPKKANSFHNYRYKTLANTKYIFNNPRSIIWQMIQEQHLILILFFQIVQTYSEHIKENPSII